MVPGNSGFWVWVLILRAVWRGSPCHSKAADSDYSAPATSWAADEPGRLASPHPCNLTAWDSSPLATHSPPEWSPRSSHVYGDFQSQSRLQ